MDTIKANAVSVTRIINPCTLIEVGDHAFLTDPYFRDHRLFPMNEPIGLSPDQLPQLDAILGGHGVFDHWRPRSMKRYKHHDETLVLTATGRMARQARRAGFTNAKRIQWNESVEVAPDIEVICLPGERVLAGFARTNNYLIKTPEVTVFVGTEACSLDPIRRCAEAHDVDIAVLPIDGLTFGSKQLVMDAAAALEATETLGAHTLTPIHYSQKPVSGLWTCPSGIDDLLRLAVDYPDLTVRSGTTGERVLAS